MALTADILSNFYIGEAKSLVFTIYQSDGTTPQNITGWAVTYNLRTSKTASATISKTVGSGITLTTPASGILTVTLSASDTSALTERTYVQGLKRTDSGSETVLAEGQVVVKQAPVP